MRYMTAAVAALTTAALGLSACGGDDKPSKSEYIKDADAICAEYEKKGEEAATKALGEVSGEPTPEQIQAAAKASVPILREELEKLRDLEQPDGEGDKIDAIYAKVEAATGELEKAGDDPDAAQALLSGDDPFADITKDAKAFGFTKCGAAD
jgi:hypothetical protein